MRPRCKKKDGGGGRGEARFVSTRHLLSILCKYQILTVLVRLNLVHLFKHNDPVGFLHRKTESHSKISQQRALLLITDTVIQRL